MRKMFPFDDIIMAHMEAVVIFIGLIGTQLCIIMIFMDIMRYKTGDKNFNDKLSVKID